MSGWMVAAFFAGMVFAAALAVVGLWWATRGDTTDAMDDCPHCDGLGVRLTDASASEPAEGGPK